MFACIKMGRIFSTFIKRPYRNFNVDNRAMKVIESEKIRPSPKYKNNLPATGAKKEERKIDETLLERLKLVKVVSENSSSAKQGKEDEERSTRLPQDRSYTEPPEFGFVEEVVIPKGKVSLRMVLEFLNHHQTDPKVWNAQLIAKEYKLDLALTQQVLKHFSLYNVMFPEKSKPERRFFSIEDWKKAVLPEKATIDKTHKTPQS